MNYKTVFANAGLSLGFEFVSFEDHKVKLKCKSCGFTFEKWDDFLRRSYHGKVRCPNCKASTKYIHQGRESKIKTKLNAENLILLVNQGKSVSEICSALNVGEYRVRKFLQENNLETVRYSQEALAKMEKTKAERTESSSVSWREKFDQLNINGFEYVRFEGNHTHLIRCKKCGEEFTRGSGIFKGQQKNFICPSCRNGSKCYSNEVDEILSYYAEGHSVKETAQRFAVTEYQVADWAKIRHVSNGRTFEQIARECNLKRSQGLLPMPNITNEKQIEQARKKWNDRLLERGFELIEYAGKGKPITFRCFSCGEILKRRAYTDLYKRGFSCPHCKEVEKQAREQEAKVQRELRRVKKENAKKLREEEKDKRLDAIRVCKVCGREYTSRQYMESCGLKLFSNPGYCSLFCKKKQALTKGQEYRKKSHTHGSNHYSRARKLGLPRERGITLKNLIERNGLTCAICGLPCFYEGDGKGNLYPSVDHIIPMSKGGGHTWDNVQIAHRICNSNKRDCIGEEWNNGTEKTA